MSSVLVATAFTLHRKWLGGNGLALLYISDSLQVASAALSLGASCMRILQEEKLAANSA